MPEIAYCLSARCKTPDSPIKEEIIYIFIGNGFFARFQRILKFEFFNRIQGKSVTQFQLPSQHFPKEYIFTFLQY